MEAIPRRYLLLGAIVLGLLIALATSNGAGDWWLPLGGHRARFNLGLTEPVLGRDAGYYLFSLPWFQAMQEFAAVTAGATLLVTLLLYAGVGAIRWHNRRLIINDLARFHLAALLAAFALALFWGYRLEPAEYVAGVKPVAIDAVLLEVRVPVSRMLSLVALLVALVSIAWLWLPNVAVVAGAWTLLGSASVVGHFLLPLLSGAVRPPQRLATPALEVAGSALERIAYGLPPAETTLAVPDGVPAAGLSHHREALGAAPVWDDFALVGALNGAARAESHFRFWDAGLGLYPDPQGRLVPVFVAAREVDLNAVRENGGATWEQLHTIPYGHSTGVFAVVAGRSGREGHPLFAPDLARPDSAVPRVVPVRLNDREIFFSPAAGDYSVVAADSSAFAGVRAGGFARRLALAWALQSASLVTAELIDRDVMVLWDRAVGSRLERFAPFLRFGTAYPVVAQGRLYWLAPGYMATRGFPLVRPLRWRDQPVRYLRAGFIGIVEARSGRTSVYLLDEPDPLSAAWARLTPEIVRPHDSLPPELARQVRYPEELFRSQRDLLGGPTPTIPVIRARVARGEPAPRRSGAPLWAGPWAGDTVVRLRLVARLDDEQSNSISAVLHGTVEGARQRLTLTRLVPPVPLVSAAEVSQRLASVRPLPVGIMGPRRSIVLPEGILTIQSAYATGDGPPRLVDVMVQWGDVVARGLSLPEAIASAVAARQDGVGGDAEWFEARRWFERLDQARQRGDWTAFGRAYEELRRLFGARRPPAQ